MTFKQRLVWIAGIFIVLTGVSCQQNMALQSEAYKRSHIASMYEQYAEEFPLVESITVEYFQQLQQQGKKMVLVDVRSPEEREVSIIPGAISVEEFEVNLPQYKNGDATIIAYCTIGYRSGKYARKLKQQKINILNLEGSLLAWSHVRGKLVDSAGLTRKVHVFGRKWNLTAEDYEPVW